MCRLHFPIDLIDLTRAVMVSIRQWYCRFYLGRRSEDDARQIGR